MHIIWCTLYNAHFCLHPRVMDLVIIVFRKCVSRSVMSNFLQPRGLYVVHQVPLSMGFSRQEYWSGLPFPSPGDLSDPRIEPESPALQTNSLPSEPPWKPFILAILKCIFYCLCVPDPDPPVCLRSLLAHLIEILKLTWAKWNYWFVGHPPKIVTSSLSSVQFSHSVMSDSATPWTAAHQAFLSITNSRSLLKLMSIESVMPSNHLILCCPLLLPLSIFPSIRVFSNELVLCIRWPKYWSFRMDWLDLLAVQGTPKSLLQHHDSEASVLWHSAFLMVKLSHPYMTAGKTIALTKWTFVGKVMCLLFNMLSRLVITFLPKRKHLLISSLTSS